MRRGRSLCGDKQLAGSIWFWSNVVEDLRLEYT